MAEHERLRSDEELKKLEEKNKEIELYLKEQEDKRKNFEFLINNYVKLLLVFIPLMLGVFLIFNSQTPLLNLVTTNNRREMQIIYNKISSLDQGYNSIQKELAISATDSASRNMLIRLANIETKQDALSQTILVDADKALTARLLREKQQDLEARFAQVQSNQSELNNKIDNIVTATVVIPIGGVVLTLVSGFIIYLFSKLKGFKNEK